jgi:hypothetical protein
MITQKTKIFFILICAGIIIIPTLLVSIYFTISQNQSGTKAIDNSISSLSTNSVASSIFSDKIQSQNNTSEVSKSVVQSSLSSSLSISIDPAKQEYLDYATILTKLVNEKDPQAALNKIAQDFNSNPLVQDKCHSLTHVIGNVALEKYNYDIKKTLTFNKEVCGGGYTHGIIEHFLTTSKNPENEILTLCGSNDEGCFHGMGHGIMILKKYNTDESVKLCQKLKNNVQQVRCGEGVFMEIFDAENASDDAKLPLDEPNPTARCSKYNSLYQDTCYYYGGRFIFRQKKDPKIALSECLKFRSANRNSCVKGMSAGIVRANLFNAYKMEDFCPSAKDLKNTCYQGAVNYQLFIINDLNETKNNFCGKFKNNIEKSLCLNAIDNSPFKQ